jgi:hypothetical protein
LLDFTVVGLLSQAAASLSKRSFAIDPLIPSTSTPAAQTLLQQRGGNDVGPEVLSRFRDVDSEGGKRSLEQ